MPRIVLLPVLSIAAFSTAPACAAVPQSAPSVTSSADVASSGLSLSTPASASPSTPAITTRPNVREGLVVRADTIEVPVAVAVDGADPVTTAQSALQALTAAIGTATKRRTTLRTGQARFERHTTARGSASAGEAGGTERFVVEARVEVALGVDLDFWARARLLEAVGRVRTGRTTDEVRVNLGPPQVVVLDAEAHRTRLLEHWATRQRALVVAGEGDASAKVHLADCAPAGAVQQTSLGPDEVLLTLPLSCKVSGAAAAAR